MSWLTFLPDLLVVAALVLLPGALVLVAGGMRGFFALAAAPAVSVTLVAGGAVLASMARVPWGWLPVVAMTAVAVVVALGFAWLRRRLLGERGLAFPSAGWAWWAALGLAVVLGACHMRNVLDTPDAFSQTFDNVWHLNAIHHMVVTGDASSLTVAFLNSSGGGFYPAAFHDLAAFVTLYNGGGLLPAVNAVTSIIVGVVWPLSCLFLVRCAFVPRDATVVAVGVLTASFTGFPLLLVNFGVLYANLLGLALLPAVLGVVVQVAGLGQDRWLDTPRAVVLLVAMVPALLLSHPNAFMSLLLVSSAFMVFVIGRLAVGLFREPRRLASWVGLALALAVIGATFFAWPRLRPGTSVDDWPPPLSTPSAVGYALTNAPLEGMANWVVSALMVLGIAVALRRGMAWLVAGWAVVVYFWLVISSFAPDEYRLALVGIWYNDSSRFAANLPLLALPLAAVGVDAIVEWLIDLGRRHAGPGERWERGRGHAGLALGLALALILGTQATSSMNKMVDTTSGVYEIRPDSPLIDTDEYRLLQRVPDLVPPDAVIANNPWNGSALAYALANRRVTAPHLLYGMTPVREIVVTTLDEARTNPAVCPVVRSEGVRYVLDFGNKGVHGPAPVYPGLDQLTPANGFVEIAREGHARLFEITACR